MAAAVLVAFIIILAVSDSPLESIRIFLVKPFSSLRYIGNIIETATPLMCDDGAGISEGKIQCQ